MVATPKLFIYNAQCNTVVELMAFSATVWSRNCCSNTLPTARILLIVTLAHSHSSQALASGVLVSGWLKLLIPVILC